MQRGGRPGPLPPERGRDLFAFVTAASTHVLRALQRPRRSRPGKRRVNHRRFLHHQISRRFADIEAATRQLASSILSQQPHAAPPPPTPEEPQRPGPMSPPGSFLGVAEAFMAPEPGPSWAVALDMLSPDPGDLFDSIAPSPGETPHGPPLPQSPPAPNSLSQVLRGEGHPGPVSGTCTAWTAPPCGLYVPLAVSPTCPATLQDTQVGAGNCGDLPLTPSSWGREEPLSILKAGPGRSPGGQEWGC